MRLINRGEIRKAAVALASLRVLAALLSIMFSFAGSRAGEQTAETIAGVPIPIPTEMKKATEQTVELMVPGYRGGQVAYRGSLAPSVVVGFYRKKMAEQGWTPYAAFITGGGLLVFTKAHQSVLVMVGEGDSETTLAIMVGTRAP